MTKAEKKKVVAEVGDLGDRPPRATRGKQRACPAKGGGRLQSFSSRFTPSRCRSRFGDAGTRYASRFTRRAFTLIELLVVIVIIGVLLGMLTAALRYARENAKRGRASSDVTTLGAAIWAYRHEYGHWPCDKDQGIWEFSDKNYEVKGYMEVGSVENPRKVQFVNWSEYLTNGVGNLVDPWGTNYVIILNIDSDTVTVSNSTTGASKTF